MRMKYLSQAGLHCLQKPSSGIHVYAAMEYRAGVCVL